jgi:catechol 2,3-dioxygenase-like lactoylglutathione lyase family enzyme
MARPLQDLERIWRECGEWVRLAPRTYDPGGENDRERDFAMDIDRLNHVAYRCRDAQETAEFYRDVLGLKLAHVITQDRVPSTQAYAPHCHLFFEMGDGSWVAFFDLIDEPEIEQGTNPDWAQHLALEVPSVEVLEQKLDALRSHGIDVLGPVDHGFIRSIYFYDPSGHRLELAARTIEPGELDRYAAEAADLLDDWTTRKKEEAA